MKTLITFTILALGSAALFGLYISDLTAPEKQFHSCVRYNETQDHDRIICLIAKTVRKKASPENLPQVK
ncbi:MAG: hypothetical protein ACRBBN_10475 [Methyloligellaceae bacterium]